ncbi:hypothetical protein [uncultured Dysosmobacter sp.]|uniref:hypothetical protein n=1 Tax=uncultured Dysosmobacter sp. TaxID=2591384 RepID=UPI002627D321|nr:hypothetical protein [uncultured Dysosmobacter sp.]
MTNEEKILSLLENQGKLLEKHSELLEKHSELLEKHSELLERQGDELRNINLTLENQVFPQLQALAEGQKTILETLAPKSRVEALEDEMAFMKSVIKALSQEVAELKKAQ